MEAAGMGSDPEWAELSQQRRAWIQGWLRDGLGAGLRGSGAWQAPVEPMRGRGEQAGVWSISSGEIDARE